MVLVGISLSVVVLVDNVIARFGSACSGFVDLADPLTGGQQSQNETDSNGGDADFAATPGHALSEAKNHDE